MSFFGNGNNQRDPRGAGITLADWEREARRLEREKNQQEAPETILRKAREEEERRQREANEPRFRSLTWHG